MWLIGIPLGIFVGALSGTMFLLIVKTGFESTGSIKHLTAVIGELVGLASFALGGTWLAKGILKGVDVGQMDFLSHYIISFAATFLLIVSWCLFKVVIKIGNEIGQPKEAKE
jgi:hypothetical protein